ncbi:MAG: hypothetical protein ACLFNS_02145 [Desulfobacterales bacterium]
MNWLRQPKTPPKKPWGTTRTLAGGEYPFGWCKLVFPETVRAKQKDWPWPFERRDLEAMVAEKNKEAAKARQAAEEKIANERAAKERKRREEEKKARLASMSPEEQLLLAFEEKTISEEQVNAIFNQLDNYPDARKLQFANAIKAYWQETGKWSKKSLSRKQWVKQREKIQKIKDVIGEA